MHILKVGMHASRQWQISNIFVLTLIFICSQVPAIVFIQTSNSTWLITCGRDQLIAVWDISSNLETPHCIKLIPSMEEVERVIHVSNTFVKRNLMGSALYKSTSKHTPADNSGEKEIHCITGGEKGKLRLWNITSGREVNINEEYQTIHGAGLQSKISDIHLTGDEKDLYIVQDDLISRVHLNLPSEKKVYDISLTSTNQYEVLDFAILENYLLIATTSSVLKLYEFSDANHGRLICVSADPNGHSDAILAVSNVLEEKREHFVSCGKDQSVCLWKLSDDEGKKQIKLIAKGVGHSSYVGAVTATNQAIYSASKDGIIKLWSWPKDISIEEQEEERRHTLLSKRNIAAHTSGK